MKNREYLKKYLFQSLIVVILVLVGLFLIGRIEYNKYKQNFNYKISAIIGVLQEEYPNLDEEKIIEILNSEDESENVLSEYGYDIDTDSFVLENDADNLTFSIMKLGMLLISFLILIYLFVRYISRNDKEIDKIIKCIENINHKNYELQLDELSEDRLSILKQEIYKTTVMLKEQAENSLKDKVNLKNSLQDISHQLKTPLTSINILLDNIIDDPDMDSDVREDFVKQIKREIANITFLVQSILKLSEFEANTINFIKEEVAVEIIIDETIKNVSNLCDLKDVSIEVDNKCKNKINCDYRWQVEALTNILKNAVEYSSFGGRVIIECEDNNLYSQIKIIDFGKGMDEEDALNIFKRFYKGKDSGRDSVGIGLSLALAIIEKDNGKVSVESSVGKGTVFTIKYFKQL